MFFITQDEYRFVRVQFKIIFISEKLSEIGLKLASKFAILCMLRVAAIDDRLSVEFFGTKIAQYCLIDNRIQRYTGTSVADLAHL